MSVMEEKGLIEVNQNHGTRRWSRFMILLMGMY